MIPTKEELEEKVKKMRLNWDEGYCDGWLDGAKYLLDCLKPPTTEESLRTLTPEDK